MLSFLWRMCRRAGRDASISNGIVRVFVERTEYGTVVAFPGTGEGVGKVQAIFAWLVNALYPSWRGVHAGWQGQLLSVYLPLRRALAEDLASGAHVICTGYSQGAALARILCDHLAGHGYSVVCHGFAMPRPFRMWKRAQGAAFAYRNGNDLVTRLPFIWMLYKHGSDVVRIGRKRVFPSIADHFPEPYERAIIDFEKAE